MTFEEFKNKKGEITVVEEAATFTNFNMDKLNSIEGLIDDDNKSSGSEVIYYDDVINYIVRYDDDEYEFDTIEEINDFIKQL